MNTLYITQPVVASAYGIGANPQNSTDPASGSTENIETTPSSPTTPTQYNTTTVPPLSAPHIINYTPYIMGGILLVIVVSTTAGAFLIRRLHGRNADRLKSE